MASTTKGGISSRCKQCDKEYYQANRDKILEYNKKYRQANKEKIAEYHREYYQENHEEYKKYKQVNKEKISDYQKEYNQVNREKQKEYQKEYNQANREKLKEYQQTNRAKINSWAKIYQRERRRSDPLFRLKQVLRVQSGRVKSKFGTKSRTAQLLGCTWEQAQTHLIQTAVTNYAVYVENENYHVDHIIPLSSATTEEEAIALCHYTNLQLLTPEDNFAKSDRLDWQLGA